MIEPDPRTLAKRLHDAADGLMTERVSVQELAAAHGAAAQGAWLILLALPCALPVPGAGTVLGLGLMLLAWRMWLGHAPETLPHRVARMEMSRDRATHVLQTLARFHGWGARWSQSRLTALVDGRIQSWAPLFIGLMALLIVLPIPFGNLLPAVAVALLGLGLVHRDGVMVALSFVAATLATGYVAGLGLSVWLLGGEWLAGFGWA